MSQRIVKFNKEKEEETEPLSPLSLKILNL